MEDFYKKLAEFKKDKGLKNKELGRFIDKSPDAFRVAVKRKSLSELEKEKISDLFGSEQKPNKLQAQNRFEDIIAQKVRELNKKEFEAIHKKLDNLKTQNRDINELLIGLASVYEEILNRVSDIQKSVKN